MELRPETERLVQEEISSGRVQSVDELIVEGVRALRKLDPLESPRPRETLYGLLTRAPFAGSGLNIERQKDYPMPVEL